MLRPPVSKTDLDHILYFGEQDWKDMAGSRWFVTGGTGFFGTWLLESITAANARLNTGIETWILTRDPHQFAERSPHLANNLKFHWVVGDVRSFSAPAGSFTHVIHGATPASAELNENAPLSMLETIVDGTRSILNFSLEKNVQSLLLASSGAVYGPQPLSIPKVDEAYQGGPDCTSPLSAYGEGKRIAELLCAIAAYKSSLQIKIARCFTFTGPHLPLDAHFAIGNFIRDALAGKSIEIKGDGRPLRSYLYAADLIVWLIRILNKGRSLYPYNVGSDEAVSITELANKIAKATTCPGVNIALHSDGTTPPRYVPDIKRATSELNLDIHIDLETAIARTLDWLGSFPSHHSH